MTFSIPRIGFDQGTAGGKTATAVPALKAMDRGLELLAR
jgi:hypothetical protein